MRRLIRRFRHLQHARGREQRLLEIKIVEEEGVANLVQA
jgi:hypothetical protein